MASRSRVGSRTIEEGALAPEEGGQPRQAARPGSGHRLHREQVMDTLWPELGMRAASNNLRQTLHTARRTLDPTVGSSLPGIPRMSRSCCARRSACGWTSRPSRKLRNARRSREPAAYRAALDLYAGELLPSDRYEEWAEEPRRRLQETYLSLLLGLADLHEELADYDSAIEALRRVVSEEPTREEAHAGLMRLYALAGNDGEALAQYGRLEEVLSRALGTEPAASSRALREEIAAGRFPPAEGPALASPPEGHRTPAGTTCPLPGAASSAGRPSCGISSAIWP